MIAMRDREAIDAERGDRTALEHALLDLGSTIKGNSATCVSHEDKTPSASITESKGAWRLYCHVCEKGWDVYDLRSLASGRPVGEQLREKRAEVAPVKSKPAERQEKEKRVYENVEAMRLSLGLGVESVYRYDHPESGDCQMVVFRLKKSDGKKTFLQGGPVPGGFTLEAPPKPWPLYRRQEMALAESVLVVEGEKCVHALERIGLAATTSPGGAGKAAYADWSPLAGKSVYLWPDNDPADPKTGKRTGIDHMRDVARMLEAIDPAPIVYWIDPDGLGLPDKGDVADLLDAMDASPNETLVDCIREIQREATSLGAAEGVSSLIEDTIAGRRKAMEWPWPRIGNLSKALLPGTVTLLCGSGGATKSFFMLQALAYWFDNGTKAVAFELEDDRTYHLTRALAQKSSGRMLDDEWVMKNPEQARAALADQKKFLNGFGRCLWETPDVQLSLKDLSDWVEARAKSGARIVVIDPITAAQNEAQPWASDLAFIMRVKKLMRDHGSSLILVTHPKKNTTKGKPSSMDDVAGGAAYQRFSHTILYMEVIEASEGPVSVMTPDGIRTLPINRAIRIHKARNGRGTGMSVGLMFDGSTMSFREVGVIQPKQPKPKGQKPGPPIYSDTLLVETPPRAEKMYSEPSDKEDLFS